MNRYPNISEMKESSKVILDSRRFCHKPTGVKRQRLFITIIITIVMCSSRPSVVESFSSQPFLGRNDQPHLDQQPYVNRKLFYSHLDRYSYRNQQTNLSRINSATIDPPRAYGGDSSDMSSFQKKMLERMTGKKLTTTRRSKRIRTVKLPPNVQTVRTLEEYKKVVAGEKDRLVVVRFFATWCKACKAITPAFFHLANKYPNVSFVDVPVTEKTADLHQGLGVPSIPFAHIYHPQGGLVEELKMSRKHFPRFEQALHSYVSGSCSYSEGDS
uniref:Thioredoxin domain-containing protein n=1 Tax=Ditylum brightwellii TaxID=49249 RepID=A0A7S4T142_9STRA|mmetsp:Transcript_63217/g.93811  ORF Transcript_63217/g.93811 Transcript_63217/m.93811 type:complete len:271 (+) Transcript_63217:134-946(+)